MNPVKDPPDQPGVALVKKRKYSELADRSDYTVITDIASGSFGLVQLAEKDHGSYVAMKRFFPARGDPVFAESISQERAIMERIEQARAQNAEDWKGVVRLVEVDENPPEDPLIDTEGPALVYEFSKYGSLQRFLSTHPKSLSFYEVCSAAVQLCKGLAQLHRLGILHRDMIARNILLDQGKRTNGLVNGLVYKVGDIGIGYDLGEGQGADTGALGATGDVAEKLKNMVGYAPAANVAPERIVAQEETKAAPDESVSKRFKGSGEPPKAMLSENSFGITLDDSMDLEWFFGLFAPQKKTIWGTWTYAQDVFALGAVLFELMSGTTLYNFSWFDQGVGAQIRGQQAWIRNSLRGWLSDRYGPIAELVGRMMAEDPAQRPTAKQAWGEASKLFDKAPASGLWEEPIADLIGTIRKFYLRVDQLPWDWDWQIRERAAAPHETPLETKDGNAAARNIADVAKWAIEHFQMHHCSADSPAEMEALKLVHPRPEQFEVSRLDGGIVYVAVPELLNASEADLTAWLTDTQRRLGQAILGQPDVTGFVLDLSKDTGGMWGAMLIAIRWLCDKLSEPGRKLLLDFVSRNAPPRKSDFTWDWEPKADRSVWVWDGDSKVLAHQGEDKQAGGGGVVTGHTSHKQTPSSKGPDDIWKATFSPELVELDRKVRSALGAQPIPVAVVVSNHTASAGEMLSHVVRSQTSKVRVFGQPTAGMLTDVVTVELPSGVVLSLEHAKLRSGIERVMPDVVASTTMDALKLAVSWLTGERRPRAAPLPGDTKGQDIQQTVSRPHGVYDVDILIRETADEPIFFVRMADVEHMLDMDAWEDAKGKLLTPRYVLHVMDGGTLDPKYGDPRDSVHIDSIQNASLIFPILVRQEGKRLDVLDGLHRLAKAFRSGHTRLAARLVSDEALKRAKMA